MTEFSQQARDLLRRFPLIDGHNDLPWALRERAGGDPNRVRLLAPAQIPGDPAAVDLAAPVEGLHTDLPRLAAGEAVTTVALDLGYDSPAAFSTMFKRLMGIAPNRYRTGAPVSGDG